MLLLALETSTDLASCALWCDGKVLERVCASGTPSSATLLPALADLLAAAEVRLAAVDAIAFGAGPGSFTGLRVACGVAQGLAFAHGLPVLPVSTLAAMAAASGEDDVMAVLDARMNEVYFGHFRRCGETYLAAGDPGVMVPASIRLPEIATAICGNALLAYPLLAERCRAHRRVLPQVMPTAAAVARLAAHRFATDGGLPAERALPSYIRDKVAFTVAERLAAGGRA